MMHNESNDVLESEKKQRETAANLAIMRERLRSMGILSQARQLHDNSNDANTGIEQEQASDTPSTVSEEDQIEQKAAESGAKIHAEESSSNSSTDLLADPLMDMNIRGRQSQDDDGGGVKGNQSSRSLKIALELKQKTAKHQRVLRYVKQ